MEEKREFRLENGITLDELIRILDQYLIIQKHMTTQRFDMGYKTILQCVDSDSNWKQFIGMDAALTIEITETKPNVISVSVGNAKWLDKIGVAAAGAIFFSPLLIAAGIGAVRQAIMPIEIFTFIESRTSGAPHKTQTRTAPVSPAPEPQNVEPEEPQEQEEPSSAVCPCCGSPVKDSYTFCAKCGTKL